MPEAAVVPMPGMDAEGLIKLYFSFGVLAPRSFRQELRFKGADKAWPRRLPVEVHRDKRTTGRDCLFSACHAGRPHTTLSSATCLSMCSNSCPVNAWVRKPSKSCQAAMAVNWKRPRGRPQAQLRGTPTSSGLLRFGMPNL